MIWLHQLSLFFITLNPSRALILNSKGELQQGFMDFIIKIYFCQIIKIISGCFYMLECSGNGHTALIPYEVYRCKNILSMCVQLIGSPWNSYGRPFCLNSSPQQAIGIDVMTHVAQYLITYFFFLCMRQQKTRITISAEQRSLVAWLALVYTRVMGDKVSLQ